MRMGLLLLGLMTMAGPSLAVVRTENAIGVLRVDSTNRETVVAVPWVATASDVDMDVPVDELFNTAELHEGDRVEYYDSESRLYEVWMLSRSDSGNLIWQAAQNISETGIALSTNRFTRGSALVLVRQGVLADHFYLKGRVAHAGSITNTLPRSTSKTIYSLIAAPTDRSFSPNDGIWTNVNTNDLIAVRGKHYQFVNGRWGRWTWNSLTFERDFQEMSDSENVLRGQGAWYISAPCTAMPTTVIWNNLPCTK